jgi:hypothetical protein
MKTERSQQNLRQELICYKALFNKQIINIEHNSINARTQIENNCRALVAEEDNTNKTTYFSSKFLMIED